MTTQTGYSTILINIKEVHFSNLQLFFAAKTSIPLKYDKYHLQTFSFSPNRSSRQLQETAFLTRFLT
jgi:hypothetical protein